MEAGGILPRTRDYNAAVDSLETLAHRIRVARGEAPADLVLKGGRVVNVFTGEIEPADVAITGDRVAGVGRYRGRTELDVAGRFVTPGFFDAHIHIESPLLAPAEFARAVVPRGTTAIATDPHEIANVLGAPGVRWVVEATRSLPLSVFLTLPSCVPATALETAGAKLDAAGLAELWGLPGVVALAEVMNFPGVLAADPAVLAKIAGAGERRVDGHAPGVRGADLSAYVAAGIRSDHEATTAEEAREKLARGMHLMIREGSAARNLAALLPAVTPETAPHCSLVSDDLYASDLLRDGHVDRLLALAVAGGVPPVTALRMATLNPARHFRLDDRGAVAPGWRADLCVVEDLKAFRAQLVLHGGRVVARDGRLVEEPAAVAPPAGSTMRIGWDRMPGLEIAAAGTRAQAVEVVPGQILTRRAVVEPAVAGGRAHARPEADVAKLAVVERHRASGNVGLGFVKGLGLRRGALASSVAHDSHNVIAAGVEDADLMLAIREVERRGGGMVAVAAGQVRAALDLPIAGLLSPRPLAEVAAGEQGLREAARGLGSTLPNPFMTLSFLALPVIPELRLTDRGLVDVEKFAFVPLFV